MVTEDELQEWDLEDDNIQSHEFMEAKPRVHPRRLFRRSKKKRLHGYTPGEYSKHVKMTVPQYETRELGIREHGWPQVDEPTLSGWYVLGWLLFFLPFIIIYLVPDAHAWVVPPMIMLQIFGLVMIFRYRRDRWTPGPLRLSPYRRY